MFSDNYSAIAGRVGQGYDTSPACNCGDEAVPECYDETANYQPCNYEGYLSRPATSPETGKTDNNTSDTASLGLMFFVSAYMFWRFVR
jgi:hypothetical protein